MKDNVDIFIGTHQEFRPPVTNKAYKIIIGNHNDINIDTDLEVLKLGDTNDILDDKFYSELYMLHKLIETNYPFKDYVGFCHYRKYFSFMNDIPDMDYIFQHNDVITTQPLYFRYDNRKMYEIYHSKADIETLQQVIRQKYSAYSRAFAQTMNSNILVPYNMVIMPRQTFIEYVNLIWNVLQDFIKEIGTDIEERIHKLEYQYTKGKPFPNNTMEYQYRIGGYLAERLTNVFIIKHNLRMKTYPAIITEAKYKGEHVCP